MIRANTAPQKSSQLLGKDWLKLLQPKVVRTKATNSKNALKTVSSILKMLQMFPCLPIIPA